MHLWVPGDFQGHDLGQHLLIEYVNHLWKEWNKMETTNPNVHMLR